MLRGLTVVVCVVLPVYPKHTIRIIGMIGRLAPASDIPWPQHQVLRPLQIVAPPSRQPGGG